jgi:hypothetical protein
MGILDKLLGIIQQKKGPEIAFHQAYDDLVTIASLLIVELKALRTEQEKLVGQLVQREEKLAGQAGLSKTLAILDVHHEVKEGLIPDLQRLVARYYQHLSEGETKTKEEMKFTPEEELELIDAKQLLNEIKKLLVNLKEIKELKTTKEKLEKVEFCLKEIVLILKKFQERKKYGLERQILAGWNKIKLVKKVYERSKLFYFCKNGHKLTKINEICPLCKQPAQSLLEFPLSSSRLTEFESEAEYLNSLNDPKNKVIWRRWWREKQYSEQDYGTGYEKEHINVWIKLKGKEKKNIHLLVN